MLNWKPKGLDSRSHDVSPAVGSGHNVLSVQLLIKGKNRTDWVINIPSEVPHHCCCTQQTLSLPASLPNWWPVSPSQTSTLWDWQLQPAAVFDYTVLYNIFFTWVSQKLVSFVDLSVRVLMRWRNRRFHKVRREHVEAVVNSPTYVAHFQCPAVMLPWKPH